MNALVLTATFLAVLFLGTWWFARRIHNESIVDVAWALAFAPTAMLYAALGSGWGTRRLLVAGLIVLWSLRLGIHLWARVASHHPEQDPRYDILRERWSAHPKRAFLIFFLAQGLLVWLLMVPLSLIMANPAPGFEPWEWAGFGLWAVALGGEALSDRQLKRFKRREQDPKAICEEGLWHYSRHPNYFFQSLLWWGLFFMALSMPWGWLTIIAPLAMLHFILNVTGIPLTEELALKKRGDAYRDYQRRTSAFVPLPPRS